MSGTLAGAVPKLLIYCTVLRECVGNRFAERNRKYRWPQSSHRYGPICKTAYRTRSVAVRLCDLRTALPRHRGHMLWLCTRPESRIELWSPTDRRSALLVSELTGFVANR